MNEQSLLRRAAKIIEEKKGEGIVAIDLTDGKVQWTYPVPKPVQEGSVACVGGALFCYAPTLGALALDLKTGQERWLNTTDAPGLLKEGLIGQYVSVGANWATQRFVAARLVGHRRVAVRPSRPHRTELAQKPAIPPVTEPAACGFLIPRL